MKIRTAIFVALIFALCLTACAKPAADSETTAEETTEEEIRVPEIKITICGEKVNNSTLKECAMYGYYFTGTDPNGEKISAYYTGYRMKEVFAAAGITDIPQEVLLTSSDGESFVYSGDLSSPSCLLAVTKDDEFFKGGPWFAPCDSEDPAEFMKNLSAIER